MILISLKLFVFNKRILFLVLAPVLLFFVDLLPSRIEDRYHMFSNEV